MFIMCVFLLCQGLRTQARSCCKVFSYFQYGGATAFGAPIRSYTIFIFHEIIRVVCLSGTLYFNILRLILRGLWPRNAWCMCACSQDTQLCVLLSFVLCSLLKSWQAQLGAIAWIASGGYDFISVFTCAVN